MNDFFIYIEKRFSSDYCLERENKSQKKKMIKNDVTNRYVIIRERSMRAIHNEHRSLFNNVATD